ncbi:serine--tRNA ligase [Candidatus Woesearchaeota archaeon]|nr:MAG: serine--tRNA ligase [Candidatus Woesearchaeota archaeon]
MLDINLIREHPEIVRQDLEKRKDEKIVLVDELLRLDEEWRKSKQELDALRSKRNSLSKEIAAAKKAGKDVSSLLEESKAIPQQIKLLEDEVERTHSRIQEILMTLPNITHETVPYGKDDSDNVEVRSWGERKTTDVKNHIDVAEALDLVDFDRAVKISGAGFYFLKNELALLNQALIAYARDTLMKKGYLFYEVPFMMRKKPYAGVTDLSDFENVMYKVEEEDEYLIATSEHPLTAQFMDEVLPQDMLPLKIVGLSHCFRKEIGSSGLDTKGLFRVHQFTKVEQVVICKPEESWDLHEEMIRNAEEIFQGLGLPYRVVNICTGDLGTVAAKKYDIEVWSPRQQKYIEVVSGSNCTDYQARRLNIRYGEPGKPKQPLAHTLNCTGIATSRAMVAILEHYQQEDGSVLIPQVLVPYMNGIERIKR